jgi:uncharacterized protein YecE (DUF72 family)
MARCFVGLPQLRGKLTRYAERFDMVEVRPLDTPLPEPSQLARWREQVPPAFAFSVVLPRAVTELVPGPGLEQALGKSLDAARALQARCVILATPATVRPTKPNRERIVELGRRLPEHGHVVGWLPAGMWEIEDVFATAHRAGLLPVMDAARDPLPQGPIAYTRIQTMGQASQLGAASIERIVLQLQGRREAFVVVDAGAAQKLRAALSDTTERRAPRRLGSAVFRPGGHAAVLNADDEEQ